MAKKGDGGIFILLMFFICCVVSCIVGIIMWANGGALPGGLTAAQIAKAISGIKFTQAVQPNIIQAGGGSTGSFNFDHVLNATTVEGSDMGSLVTGKSQNDCDALCHSTNGCVGYTIDGTNCQLKNNVTLLEFKPGVSNLYSSGDIGGTLYQHFPYSRVDDGIYKSLWTFNGSLADAVSNCKANKDVCKGFTWDGTNTAVMYPRVLAVNGQGSQSGQAGVYTTLDQQPQFVTIGNQGYADTPTRTVTTVPQWSQSQPFNPTSDSDYFTNVAGPGWQGGSGWDAGPDSRSQKYDGVNYQHGLGPTASSNTITVSDLNGCMNACVKNTWCQSFVFDSSVKSCYMRRDQAAWPAVKLDAPTNQVCTPGGYYDISSASTKTCDCGVIDNSSCNTNTIGPGSGKGDGNKVSYIRLNPPLAEYCPQQCQNDINCVVGWYDTTNGNCNLYEFTPSQVQTNQSTKTTTWMLQNFS